jgi:hypothetical protein
LIRPFLWLLFTAGIARQVRLSRRKVSSKWRADATIENANWVSTITLRHPRTLTVKSVEVGA